MFRRFNKAILKLTTIKGKDIKGIVHYISNQYCDDFLHLTSLLFTPLSPMSLLSCFTTKSTHVITKMTDKMQLCRLIYCSLTALHASINIFAHHSSILTVFTASGIIHVCGCLPLSWMSLKCLNCFQFQLVHDNGRQPHT